MDLFAHKLWQKRDQPHNSIAQQPLMAYAFKFYGTVRYDKILASGLQSVDHKMLFVWRHLLRKLHSDQLRNIKVNDVEQIEMSSGGNWIFNYTILIFEWTRSWICSDAFLSAVLALKAALCRFRSVFLTSFALFASQVLFYCFDFFGLGSMSKLIVKSHEVFSVISW